MCSRWGPVSWGRAQADVDAARPCRHAVGSRWFVDETYVKVAGVWRYVYRAIDERGQVIDVLISNQWPYNNS